MDRHLRDELLSMEDADSVAFEELRNACQRSAELQARVTARSTPGSSSPAWPVEWTDRPPPEILRLQTIVERNTRRLKQIIGAAGWPGRKLVGDDGATAAWRVAHHTADIEFQRECLALLSRAVDEGDADPLLLEWLTDRVLLREGQPERYRTHTGSRGRAPAPQASRGVGGGPEVSDDRE